MSSWIEHKPKQQGDRRIWHRTFTPPVGGASQVTKVYAVVIVDLQTCRTKWDAKLDMSDGRVLHSDGSDFNERSAMQKLSRAINRLLTTIGDPTELPGEVRFR